MKLTLGKQFFFFCILHTSTREQNFAEGPKHSGNDVVYTRSYWELDLV